jgi:hypothetical protein
VVVKTVNALVASVQSLSLKPRRRLVPLQRGANHGPAGREDPVMQDD